MVSLITEHFDVWTAAQTQKNNWGRGRGNGSANHSLYGIKKLRELILELAVRGKLVSQNPDDEPAGELLKKIAKEKARLIKEGKIKKQKPLPKISEDEKPFDLPEGWEWTRVGAVTNYGISDKAEPISMNEDTWVLELEDVEKETSKLLQKVKFVDRQFRSSKNRFCKGDVIYGKLRPYLDKVIIADEDGVCTTEMIPLRGYNHITPQYLRFVMKSPYFIGYANESTHGMNLPRMGTEKARQALFPMVSEAEQHRIVAKVDELMALCDQLEQQQTASNAAHQTLVETLLATLTSAADQVEFAEAWQRINNHFDTLLTTEHSIDLLKQTILQLAVMGKLVPQDPNAEPASVLIEKIAKEKKRLIKDGKIKKQKPLPKITEDETPFDLPEGWVWSRIGDLGQTQTGTTPSTIKSEYFGKGYPFIKPANITNKGVFYDGDELTEAGIAVGRLIPNGSALMVCIGGSIGKVGYTDRVASCNQQINAITPFARIDAVFIAYWMKSPLIQQQVLLLAPQTTLPILSKGKWELLLFPLPPLAEQRRIVAKVDELMALCDTLKARLNDAQATQVQLADAVVEQAVA